MSSDKDRDSAVRSGQAGAHGVDTQPLIGSPPAPDLEMTERMFTANREKPPCPSADPIQRSLRPMLLERIEPSLGRGERLRLDADSMSVSLGRSEACDVRLYTASASREHARIVANEAGEWVLTLGPEKAVLIDGEITMEPVILEVGMNLVLGEDHLRCVSEGLDRSGTEAETATDLFDEALGKDFLGLRGWTGRIGLEWWKFGVGLAFIAALILAVMISR
jgi:hypothetical protein